MGTAIDWAGGTVRKKQIITAKEARAKLDTELNEVATKELDVIEAKILSAIKRGDSSFRYDKCVHSATRKKLEALGYKVKNNSGGDWRDSYENCDISW